jgi:hypothetical protein
VIIYNVPEEHQVICCPFAAWPILQKLHTSLKQIWLQRSATLPKAAQKDSLRLASHKTL